MKNVDNGSEAGTIQARYHYRRWWSAFVLRRPCICLVPLALAGLSTALGLALSGHKVRVLEKMSRFGEPVGGVNVGPNVTKILTGWGLEKELEKMGAVVHDGSKLWDCELFAFP